MNTEPNIEPTCVTLERHGELGLILIDHPPVNALSPRVVTQLGQALAAFEQDRSLHALVIACAGRTFVAGGDIAAFDAPGFSAEPLNRILARLEAQDRPVIASVHGSTFGGGLELALACHWRTAQPGTRLAFPEVKLGILPGSLGTQRLPRLVGLPLALDLIDSGRTVDSAEALSCGLVDALNAGDPVAQGLAYAQAVLREGRGVRRLSERSVDTAGLPPGYFDQAREKARRQRARYPAALAIVDALEASTRPFAQGQAVEARAFAALLATPESQALRHLFFAPRLAARVPGLPASTRRRDIRSAAVVGGGTMGRGIAINFLNAAVPVVLVETSQAAADTARQGIAQVFQGMLAKGRIAQAELEHRMGLLSTALDLAAVSGSDIVIEAVFEDLALKQSVCARLGQVCKSGAIIASNTSTLNVDTLAVASGRPADFLGMHFFSPAHVMKLLEVVRGAATAPEVLATVLPLATTLGKVPVVSGVCWGFIGNRMLEPYLREAEMLLMEGATPAQVDDAVESLGFAMGPCRMMDLAGVDVCAKVLIELDKAGALPADPSYRAPARRLHEMGRDGQKAGCGFYRYEGRRAVPDAQVDATTAQLATSLGIARRTDIGQQEIRERLLYPLINEGARILEEGIAYRASDIDVVWTHGYGFPDVLGGPMFHADRIGLTAIVDRLDHYGQVRGNAQGYWTVSALLRQRAAEGGRLQGGPGRA